MRDICPIVAAGGNNPARIAKAPSSRIDTWVAGRRGFRRILPGRTFFLPVTRTGRIIIDAASPLIDPAGGPTSPAPSQSLFE